MRKQKERKTLEYSKTNIFIIILIWVNAILGGIILGTVAGRLNGEAVIVSVEQSNTQDQSTEESRETKTIELISESDVSEMLNEEEVSEISEEIPTSLSEEELIAKIENTSGLKVYGSAYDDYDGDGTYELFAVTSPYELKYEMLIDTGMNYDESAEEFLGYNRKWWNKEYGTFQEIHNISYSLYFANEAVCTKVSDMEAGHNFIRYDLCSVRCGREKVLLFEKMLTRYKEVEIWTVKNSEVIRVDSSSLYDYPQDIHDPSSMEHLDCISETLYLNYYSSILDNGQVQYDYWDGDEDFAQLWCVQGKLYEAASTEISKEALLNYNNADNVLGQIESEIKAGKLEHFRKKDVDFSKFYIDSILLCTDGNIYINYLGDQYFEGNNVPEWEEKEYKQVGIIGRVKVNGDSVELDEVYLGYRATRMTGFDPIYPNDVS